MEIIQWLLKMLQQQALETTTTSKRMLTIEEEQGKDHEELEADEVEVECKDPFAFLLTRANSRTCFSTTLNLKSIRSFCERRDCLHPVREDSMGHKAESTHVGSKVLPISDATVSSSNATDYSSDGSVNRKKKAISRMKELLRWAAATKSDKPGLKRWKVLYFRNKNALKDSADDTSSTSSKISFKWDVGGCSAYSAALSPLSLASTAAHRTLTNQPLEIDNRGTSVSSKPEECERTGNWITTDSEFVVLEL